VLHSHWGQLDTIEDNFRNFIASGIDNQIVTLAVFRNYLFPEGLCWKVSFLLSHLPLALEAIEHLMHH